MNGRTYPGTQPPLVSPDLFERCQAVFGQKRSGGRPERALTFILARRVSCPRCGATLIGERTTKPKTGKAYFYYRCHTKRCGFSLHAEDLEREVLDQLRGLRLTERLVPVLRRRVSRARRKRAEADASRVRELRAERRRIEQALKDLANSYAMARVNDDNYELDRAELLHALRATEYLLAHIDLDHDERGDAAFLAVARNFDAWLASNDVVLRRRAIEALVERVQLHGTGTQVELVGKWKDLLAPRVLRLSRKGV